MFTWAIMLNCPTYNSIFFDHFFFRQGHAAAVVDKKVYIFGGSSGSGFGGQHSDSSSDPVYLNDLFLLKGMIETVNARNSCLLSSISVVKFKH